MNTRAIPRTEEELSCDLMQNKLINLFAAEILFRTVQKALQFEMGNEIIGIMCEHTLVENSSFTTKPGFPSATCEAIVRQVSGHSAPSLEYLALLDIPNQFHKVVGSFYFFIKAPSFVKGCLRENLALQSQFTERVKEMLCMPAHTTFEDIASIILEPHNAKLYLDVLAYGTQSPSLYRRNLSQQDYIRSKHSVVKTANACNTCHENAVRSQAQQLVIGSSWYDVKPDMFFAKLLSKHGRKYLAGPSGSAVLLSILVFDLLGLKKSFANIRLLLGCIICDNVPYYHSLTEVLMTYSFEVGRRYSLDQDPVAWVLAMFAEQPISQPNSQSGGAPAPPKRAARSGKGPAKKPAAAKKPVPPPKKPAQPPKKPGAARCLRQRTGRGGQQQQQQPP